MARSNNLCFLLEGIGGHGVKISFEIASWIEVSVELVVDTKFKLNNIYYTYRETFTYDSLTFYINKIGNLPFFL